MEYTIPTVSTCIICRQVEGKGRWRLCPGCRSRLAERTVVFIATARPSRCYGCSLPRPPHSTSTGVYCRFCRARFSPAT
ncbi:MAG: hypothetical protein KKA28_00740 [Planctomycetes bacterium]|nr:hypothetical protein [Planctomycetota bacterium]MCG2683833.1 hypothetical protein [Planctomycetales bacterium]